MPRDRKKGKEEKGGGGHEAAGLMRWLLTYADMITLLMAFFVMLYSMSVLDLKKFEALADVLRMALGGRGRSVLHGGSSIFNPGAADNPKPAIVPGMDIAQMKAIAEEVRRYVEEHGLGGSVGVHVQERGIVVRIAAEGILFDRGKADLRPEAIPILSKVGKMLASMRYQVRVEGHTCSLPINTSKFPSNWELSAARAATVVRFLISMGVRPDRLSAVGYADSRPVAPQDTEENRRKNRRVDIVILR
jgi:chemotaxis protein MotB